MRHGFAQGLPASLVVHPARHSDMEIERQIVLELDLPPVKQCATPAAEDAAKIPEDGRKIIMRRAFDQARRGVVGLLRPAEVGCGDKGWPTTVA